MEWVLVQAVFLESVPLALPLLLVVQQMQETLVTGQAVEGVVDVGGMHKNAFILNNCTCH